MLGGPTAALSKTKSRKSTERSSDVLYLSFVNFPAVSCSQFCGFRSFFFFSLPDFFCDPPLPFDRLCFGQFV